MIAGARDTLLLERRKKSVPRELLTFLLITMIVSLAQSLVVSVCTAAIMMQDPKFYELALSGTTDTEALTEYTNALMENLPSWYYAAFIASSGLMILAAIIYCKKFEKRKSYTMGFCKRGFFTEYLMGMGIGLLMIVLPILACIATGSVSISLSSSINPLMIALFFGAFLLQGMGEEVFFRGYLMTTLSRRTGLWPSIIISALMFSLLHTGNSAFSFIAFINIFLFGIFAGVFMMKRGSIWAVAAIHTVWNFVQGNVFGFNVSGIQKLDSVFTATGAGFGAILSGGEFGPEGGLGVTVVLLIALLGALIMPTKRSEYVEIKKDEDIEVEV